MKCDTGFIVQAGNIVTIPRENVTIGEWYGTGYIALNLETGEGEYIISERGTVMNEVHNLGMFRTICGKVSHKVGGFLATYIMGRDPVELAKRAKY